MFEFTIQAQNSFTSFKVGGPSAKYWSYGAGSEPSDVGDGIVLFNTEKREGLTCPRC